MEVSGQQNIIPNIFCVPQKKVMQVLNMIGSAWWHNYNLFNYTFKF